MSDVGYASVIGADRVTHGETIYEGEFPPLERPGYVGHGDTYGPATYFAYVPFEQVFAWNGAWDSLPAAHTAAMFDLLTLAGLLLLGRVLWPSHGSELGLALGYAWACYPYSFYVLASNTNDGLVSALRRVVDAAHPRPGGTRRHTCIGQPAAKYVSLALAPLLATASDRRPRTVVVFSIVFGAVFLLVHVPVLPDGGFREIFDRTLGYQDGRSSVFTIWHALPELDVVRPAAVVLAAALAILVAFVPRQRSPSQIAALCAAVLIAVELAHSYWFVFYLVWWAPLAFAALFAAHLSQAPDVGLAENERYHERRDALGRQERSGSPPVGSRRVG